MRVGFIGLGRMGFPMARNLIRAGHSVVAHNRSRGPVDRIVALGATAASTPAEVARSVEILVSCVLTPEQVEHIYLGPEGALEGATRRPGVHRHQHDLSHDQQKDRGSAPRQGGCLHRRPHQRRAAGGGKRNAQRHGGRRRGGAGKGPAGAGGLRQEHFPHGSGRRRLLNQDLQPDPYRNRACAGGGSHGARYEARSRPAKAFRGAACQFRAVPGARPGRARGHPAAQFRCGLYGRRHDQGPGVCHPDGQGERGEAVAAHGCAADIPGGARSGPQRPAPGGGHHADGKNRRGRGGKRGAEP